MNATLSDHIGITRSFFGNHELWKPNKNKWHIYNSPAFIKQIEETTMEKIWDLISSWKINQNSKTSEIQTSNMSCKKNDKHAKKHVMKPHFSFHKKLSDHKSWSEQSERSNQLPVVPPGGMKSWNGDWTGPLVGVPEKFLLNHSNNLNVLKTRENSPSLKHRSELLD